MTPRLWIACPLVLLAGCSWLRAKPPEIVRVPTPYECPPAPETSQPDLIWGNGFKVCDDDGKGVFCFADGDAYRLMVADWQEMRRYAADLRTERDYYIDCITSSQQPEQTP